MRKISLPSVSIWVFIIIVGVCMSQNAQAASVKTPHSAIPQKASSPTPDISVAYKLALIESRDLSLKPNDSAVFYIQDQIKILLPHFPGTTDRDLAAAALFDQDSLQKKGIDEKPSSILNAINVAMPAGMQPGNATYTFAAYLLLRREGMSRDEAIGHVVETQKLLAQAYPNPTSATTFSLAKSPSPTTSPAGDNPGFDALVAKYKDVAPLPDAPTSPDAPSSIAASTHTIKYRVSSWHWGIGTASITYQNSTGGTSQTTSGLPWQEEETFTNGDYVYLSAQSQDDFGSVKTEIFVDNKLAKVSNSDGPYCIAECDGTVADPH